MLPVPPEIQSESGRRHGIRQCVLTRIEQLFGGEFDQQTVMVRDLERRSPEFNAFSVKIPYFFAPRAGGNDLPVSVGRKFLF